MSTLHFTKMHGLGNDFMVINCLDRPFTLSSTQIAQLGDRHFGVGFDQLLVVEPPPSPAVDFSYRIFNRDGSEVAQCGNGARCFARFVRDQGLCASDEIRVQTRAATLTLYLEAEDQVRVNMGVPNFSPPAIPLLVAEEALYYETTIADDLIRFGAVSIGNPHLVIRVPSVATAAVARLGPLLESHPLFPQRVNVGFMEFIADDLIALRVYERGSGETLACGSGACAAVVTAQRWGLLGNRVTVRLGGGELTVQWAGGDEPIWMSGPATTVFRGEIPTPSPTGCAAPQQQK
ncbi:MAG: diaminopimelate epimerase [Gammaproteobacteria bacterium]|nr:diaminopimelate epimerase [Gammaproteobacteria bacterium]